MEFYAQAGHDQVFHLPKPKNQEVFPVDIDKTTTFFFGGGGARGV